MTRGRSIVPRTTASAHVVRDATFAGWEPRVERDLAAYDWPTAIQLAEEHSLLNLTFSATNPAAADALVACAQPFGARSLTLTVEGSGSLRDGGRFELVVEDAKHNNPLKPVDVARKLLNASAEGRPFPPCSSFTLGSRKPAPLPASCRRRPRPSWASPSRPTLIPRRRMDRDTIIRAAPFALRVVQRKGGRAAVVYRRRADAQTRDRFQRLAAVSPLGFTAALPLLRDAVAQSRLTEAVAPVGSPGSNGGRPIKAVELVPGPFYPLDADWGARVACFSLVASGLRNGDRLLLAADHLRTADPDEAALWLAGSRGPISCAPCARCVF